MAFAQLVGLLNPEQFAQLEVVKKHLLADPALLDREPVTPTVVEEVSDGS